MGSHVRIKHKQFVRKKLKGTNVQLSSSLQHLFDKFDSQHAQRFATQSNAVSSKKLSPFVNFRDLADDSDPDVDMDDIKDDQPVPVSLNVVIGEHICYGLMRLSNGQTEICDKYEGGADGFVRCIWTKYDDELETDLPNSLIEPDGQFLLKPVPPPAAGEHAEPEELAPSAHVAEPVEPAVGDGADPAAGIDGAEPAPKAKAKAKAKGKEKGKGKGKKASSKKPTASLADVMQGLPLDAQKPGDLGAAKSYTLRMEGCKASISVILNKGCFYVGNAQVLILPSLTMKANAQAACVLFLLPHRLGVGRGVN